MIQKKLIRKKSIPSRVASQIWRFVQMAVWAVPALVMWLTPYRVGRPGMRAIGQLAAEPDYFLKKRALGGYPNITPVFFNKRGYGLNAALLDVWGKHVKITTNRIAYDLIRPFEYFPFLRIDFAEVLGPVDRPSQYQTIVSQWGERPPVFRLPNEVLAKGYGVLSEMGVPDGAWFVPIHTRDGIFAPTVENRYDYRNCHISNYSAAVDAIIARGGWCIRMGEKGTPPIPERQGVINYPDTPFKSDWMDLFLCNQARFFLGNTSGLKMVSTISGVPCAAANMTPHDCAFGFLPDDISIPKLLRLKDGTMPHFAEIFASDISRYHESWQFKDAGVTLLENTPQQIRDLATEMLDVLDGKAQRTAEDEARQETFRRLLTPRHHAYGTRSRIGAAFLREYAHLL
jgi:putative glycosyltransferase (TIGR04372 family)